MHELDLEVKYKFRTKPYRHQVQGIKFAMSQFREGLGVAFLFEPRTGKTKTTVDTISVLHLKYGVRRVVVICPNRVMGTWVQEFATHSPLAIHTIVWDAKQRRRGAIPPPSSAHDITVLITNFETFGTPGRKLASGRRSKASGRFKHRKMIQDWLDGDPDAACVIDEGHKLKSPSGKASNMIVGMRPLFRYRFLLTGTPITKAKRAADIYMQWKWVNPARFNDWGPTYETFREHTGVWTYRDNIPIWRRAKPQGMKDLQRGLHADGLVVHRDECFDLPKRLPDRLVKIPLSPRTARHYDEMAEEMVTRLENGEIAEASIPLVVTLRLSQITSGFVGVDAPHPTNPDKRITKPVRVGTEKISKLKEILIDEVLELEEPVVIVGRFNPDLNAAERLCASLGIPCWSIRGGMHRSATDEALRAFKRAAGGPAAMVVQPQAGGVGIDMRSASHMIWFSLTSSWVDYSQMNDRIALAERGVRYTYLLAEGTVDELLYNTLQMDGDVSKAILTRPNALLRRGPVRSSRR